MSSSLLLDRQPFSPHSYEDIREGVLPLVVEPHVYESWVKKFDRQQHLAADRLLYRSGEHQVTGFYLRPQVAGETDQKYPLIIFNRGGRGRYGMLNVLTFNNLITPLIERDYLVLASQYRGVDGGTGQDDFGGDEVQDILNLIEIGRELPEWDGRNIYLFGWSRGGMMSLLSLKHGAEVNAVALGAPLVDLTLSTDESQKREAWLQRVLPNYAQEGHAALEARSAPYWIDRLQETPLLLMHGDADPDVSVMHSRRLAQKLAQQEIPHKLVEYEGGNHYLNRQRDEVMAEVDQWFRTHRRA